jgi:hypothetical protein
MDIPDFSLWGAAGVRGKIGIMYQKGSLMRPTVSAEAPLLR